MTDLELEARNALDVLAMLTETRPGNVRLNALDTLTRALKAVRADAQALADVRTLDEWEGSAVAHSTSLSSGWSSFNMAKPHLAVPGDVRVQLLCDGDLVQQFFGATPDAARAAAAKWVREQKGERP